MVDLFGYKDKKFYVNIYDNGEICNDYLHHGLNYVCDNIYKYDKLKPLLGRNDKLDLYVFRKLLKKGFIIKDFSINGRTYYNTVVPKKILATLDYFTESYTVLMSYLDDGHSSEEEGDNRDELHNHNKYFTLWNSKIKNLHKDIMVSLYNKEHGITPIRDKKAFRKTALYKELKKRIQAKLPKKRVYYSVPLGRYFQTLTYEEQENFKKLSTVKRNKIIKGLPRENPYE